MKVNIKKTMPWAITSLLLLVFFLSLQMRFVSKELINKKQEWEIELSQLKKETNEVKQAFIDEWDKSAASSCLKIAGMQEELEKKKSEFAGTYSDLTNRIQGRLNKLTEYNQKEAEQPLMKRVNAARVQGKQERDRNWKVQKNKIFSKWGWAKVKDHSELAPTQAHSED